MLSSVFSIASYLKALNDTRIKALDSVQAVAFISAD